MRKLGSRARRVLALERDGDKLARVRHRALAAHFGHIARLQQAEANARHLGDAVGEQVAEPRRAQVDQLHPAHAYCRLDGGRDLVLKHGAAEVLVLDGLALERIL
eukprot:4762283-Prymnesium_polylepis.2